MQLIGTLASGVAGAENGYAKILVRGSSKRSRYFTDFEGDDPVEGSDVLLDENGGAVIYVDVTVDVLVYNSSDLLVRRWIESSTAACVEVVSQSFTGADYETGVGGVGLPTTVASVFDRLVVSFGAEDFLVKMPDGSEVTIQQAIESARGIYFNVRSPVYGAVGDGVANDGAKIQAAITAADLAGGGTVFFPPGNYFIGTTQITVPSRVNLMGSGANSSFILSAKNASTAVFLIGNGGSGMQTIQGLKFYFSLSGGVSIATVVAPSKVTFSRCMFEVRSQVGITVPAGKSYVVVDDCDFSISSSGALVSSLAARVGRVDMRRCRIVTLAGVLPTTVISGAGVHLLGCIYDGSAATVSGMVVVSPTLGGVAYGSVRCCEFIDAGVASITCMSLGTVDGSTEWFTEDGNVMSALHSVSRLYAGTFGNSVGYYCKLGSRESRFKTMTTAVAAPLVDTVLEYGVISLRSTFAGNIAVQIDAVAPIGARLRLMVVNGSAGTSTLTFGSNARGGSYLLGINEAIGFELVRGVVNNGADVNSWYLVGTSGVLTTGTDSSFPV